MADALEAKGYDYRHVHQGALMLKTNSKQSTGLTVADVCWSRYVFSTGSGHVDRRGVRQTLADALAWLWRDSPLLPSMPLASFLQTPYGPHLGGRQSK